MVYSVSAFPLLVTYNTCSTWSKIVEILNSAQTWSLGLQLWFFFTPPTCLWVQKGFLSNGLTAVVSFHDVHYIYTTAHQSIAKLLPFFLNFKRIHANDSGWWIFTHLLQDSQDSTHCYGAVFMTSKWSCGSLKYLRKTFQFYYLLSSKLHTHKNSTGLMNKVVYLAAKKPGIFLWGFAGEENKAN